MSTLEDISTGPASAGPSSSTTSSPFKRSGHATRLVTSVRRTLSYSSPKRQDVAATKGMYSTPAESGLYRCSIDSTSSIAATAAMSPRRTSARRLVDSTPNSSPRPSVEQIAIGLHLSRTPHLHQVDGKYPSSLRPQHERRTSAPLPPPPARSSLKKGGHNAPLTHIIPAPSAASSQSTTTLVSSPIPALSTTPRSPMSSFRQRVSQMLLGHRTSSSSSSMSPSMSECSSGGGSPRKAVRFAQTMVSLDEQTDDSD